MVVMGEGTWTTQPQFIWVGLSAIWLQPQHRCPTARACCSPSHRLVILRSHRSDCKISSALPARRQSHPAKNASST